MIRSRRDLHAEVADARADFAGEELCLGSFQSHSLPVVFSQAAW